MVLLQSITSNIIAFIIFQFKTIIIVYIGNTFKRYGR